MAALQDPSDAGLEALGETRGPGPVPVVLGHRGAGGPLGRLYAGDRNNYHFYREPDGKFVFIPWGAWTTLST